MAMVDYSYVDPKTIETVPHKGKVIDAYCCDVYDGDTCTVIFKYGEEFMKLKIRVSGIDTPEVYTRKRTDELRFTEERAGVFIRDNITKLIENKMVKIRMDTWDKYGGRVNGDVFLPDSEETLAEYLLKNNFAKPYNGGKKEGWTKEQLELILN